MKSNSIFRRGLRLSVLALLFTSPLVRAAPGDTILTVVAPLKTVSLTAEQFAGLPHSEVTALDPHQKKEHHYSGVPIRDLLAMVDAPIGDKLHGVALQLAVVVRSKDGYATLFALAEFDDAFSDRTILLADAEDGKPLLDNAGPLRVVAPGDKRAARWARMVTSIGILRLPGGTH